MDRMLSMSDLWPRLRLSACRYRDKVWAILVAAWPRALHAVASTAVSDASIHALRTGGMKGLSQDSAGSNAWVHLGIVEHPLVDPGFCSVIQTTRCAIDCGDRDQVTHAMCTLVNEPSNLPDNSITATLVSRLQVLGWHVGPEGRISDQLGTFSLFGTSLFELFALR